MCARRFFRVKSIFLAAAPMILLPMLAAAQAVTTQVTATEVFDPFNVFGNGAIGAFLDPGSVNCPGTQPTGNPAQPCPAGSRINLRGLSVTSRFVSQSPLLTGWFYSEGNANFDANASGHVWGTFRLELDSGGVWIGSWIVDRSKVDNENVWVGRGTVRRPRNGRQHRRNASAILGGPPRLHAFRIRLRRIDRRPDSCAAAFSISAGRRGEPTRRTLFSSAES